MCVTWPLIHFKQKGVVGRVFSSANAVTHAVVDSAGAVVEGAAGAVATAVSKTPGLKNIVKLYVHRCVH